MYKNGERMMAWVGKIAEIKSIPNADRIVAYRVGGWWVVDQKNLYQIDDLVVYVSIDAWVPHELAPFLSKGTEPREYQGVRGERLRTVKLKGQVSQGLLLPLNDLLKMKYDGNSVVVEGDDVSEMLGIQKWEAPVPARLAGEINGVFPNFIPKTDQERVQNLSKELNEWTHSDYTWELTEKLDGSSMTAYMMNDKFGVCSRNYDLKESDTNSFWQVARMQQLENVLRSLGTNIALQGELVGEGIQSNPYNIRGQQFYIFDIYNIDKGEFLSAADRQLFARNFNMNHVPIIDSDFRLNKNSSIDDLLEMADGQARLSKNKVDREGIVFKCNQNPQLHFKAISNKFLLKN